MDKGWFAHSMIWPNIEPRHLFGALLQTPGENTGVMFGGKQTARIFSVRQRPHHLTPKHLRKYVSALRSVLRISPASAVSMLSKAEETWASRSPTRSLSNSPGSFFRPPQISHKLGSPALSKSNGAFKGICRWIRDTDAWMKMRIKWGATWCNMSHVFRS